LSIGGVGALGMPEMITCACALPLTTDAQYSKKSVALREKFDFRIYDRRDS